MHHNSLRLVERFREEHADVRFPRGGFVLDVGSLDINGTYRELWEGWRYTGVDIEAGDNVDRVLDRPWGWSMGHQYQAVLCGQVMEHCPRPWELAKTLGEHVAPGGLLCIVAPFAWKLHRHPLDCYRFAPDGMREMLAIAGCDVLEVGLHATEDFEGIDCMGIGGKPC